MKQCWQIDLVVTEQTMPLLSGVVLAKKLLQHRSEISIILCTGYSYPVNEEEALKVGIKDFVIKPAGIELIARLIRKILDSSALATIINLATEAAACLYARRMLLKWLQY